MVDSWRAGQVIKAAVHSVPDEQTLVLRIGDKLVVADARLSTTPIPAQNFRPQQEILLRVASAGSPPTLELTESPPAPKPETLALRQMLPRQQPMPQLLSNLMALSRLPDAQLSAPLRQLRTLADTFIRALPQVEDVQTSDGIKRAISNSGPWLEHKLSTAPKGAATADVDKDLKANLAKLVQALQAQTPAKAPARAQAPTASTTPTPGIDPATLLGNTPPATRPLGVPTPAVPPPVEAVEETAQKILLDAPPPIKGAPPQAQARIPPQVDGQWPFERLVLNLLEQAEGALARVRVNQLSHTSDEQTNLQTWTVELPIKDHHQVDVLSLQISREGDRKRDPSEAKWIVTLAFDFDETGPFFAKVALQQKRVNVHITAEQTSTAARINNALPKLELSLISAGLSVDQLHVVAGPLPRGARSQIYQSLVDTHA